MKDKEQFDINAEPGFTGEISGEASRERIEEPLLEPQDRLQDIEHSICDEPALAGVESGAAGGLSYEKWLAENWASTSMLYSWFLTFLVACVAGPFAIIAALMNSVTMGTAFFGVLNMVAFGPMVEEILKVAVVYYIVEKKPYLFHNFFQIIVACFAGGLLFAAIENLVYLNIYIENPTEKIIHWRWTICTLLHVSCSVIASIGLVRMWLDILQRKARPRLQMAYPFLITAVIIHGCYNTLAMLMQFSGVF